MGKIADIMEDSEHRLSLFSNESIKNLESNIIDKKGKPYVKCLIRNKEIILKPEEVTRQLYLMELLGKYAYPKNRIKVEHPVYFGRQVKRADIVIMDEDRPNTEYIMIEIKRPKLLDGKAQLRSYANATGAPIAAWTNGEQSSYYHRKDPNYFEEISDIPSSEEELADILKEKFTLKSLIVHDKIASQRKGLKSIINEMEDEVLANAGVDVFEEVFKLIFAKLYDEIKSRDDKLRINDYLKKALGEEYPGDYMKIKNALVDLDDSDFRKLAFRNTGQTESKLREKIQDLFDEAKEKWEGIFDETAQVQLAPSHLAICISSLQNVKLFNSNLQIIDEAFEYLVNKSAKGEKGQYFTPRHVIDMCVKMLNPKAGEYMIDTAAGSCGFPVHTIFHINNSLCENIEIPDNIKKDISKIFGIDFDRRVVRVARMLNLIAGDGNTNVLHLNNLDYDRWDETVNEPEWRDIYGKGFRNLERLKRQKKSYKEFNFDIVMANPPFAGDIKESRVIGKYQLGLDDEDNSKKSIGRDILFIERNLNFLKPGGRMAIVLPQGRFNNTGDKEIREYIAKEARIIAVVGLHTNTFKPHTSTNTSILFIQKWSGESGICPKVDDYPIFFAISEKSGKDNKGNYIYAMSGGNRPKLDKNGHLIISHDLHSHDGHLSPGIAEAFIEWAKEQKLSFH